MRRIIAIAALSATMATAQPALPTPPRVPVRTTQHKGKPLLRRLGIRLAIGAAAFVATYALRRQSGPQPIIITPGRTTITWQPCPEATCGGVFTLAPGSKGGKR